MILGSAAARLLPKPADATATLAKDVPPRRHAGIHGVDEVEGVKYFASQLQVTPFPHGDVPEQGRVPVDDSIPFVNTSEQASPF
jgi:hypothetical protein